MWDDIDVAASFLNYREIDIFRGINCLSMQLDSYSLRICRNNNSWDPYGIDNFFFVDVRNRRAPLCNRPNLVLEETM